jgi:UDPglucose 6-dehydrogenase
MNLSVIGLGKLGAPLAAVLASKGHHVVGLDRIGNSVKLINEGKAPVSEPGLDSLIAATKGRLKATSDYREAIENSQITFIVVPTPSEPNGAFSLQYILEAIESIGSVLRAKSSFHLVVITSTVMPGDTANRIQKALEQYSGKRCGEEIGLCYNPEFIALGSVIRDLLNPDFILVGESDRRSGDMLSQIYSSLCDNKPEVVRMNFVNAEIAKLAVNTFVTTKISYANMLSELCERLPGADVDVVTSAIGKDQRIGSKYLKAATAYGGPCFPRDNVALGQLGRSLGTRALIAEATDVLNRRHTDRLAEMVIAELPKGGRAGILGLSYKPNTVVVEASAGIALAQALVARAVPVIAYDPLAIPSARAVLKDEVSFASSTAECVRDADVVVVTIPLEEFKDLAGLAHHNLVVIDCWRCVHLAPNHLKVTYLPIGIGPRTAI